MRPALEFLAALATLAGLLALRVQSAHTIRVPALRLVRELRF
jgi:hypothetical protein